MSGFPTRPTRLSFGPTPVNRFPVRDSAKEMDGPTTGDLIMWTVAGCGVVVPQAWALIEIQTAAPFDWALIASGESWDADGGILPVVARTGVGVGTLTYLATYPDKDGTAITTNFFGSSLDEQVLDFNKVGRSKVNANARVIDIGLFVAGGGAADDWANGERFLVKVW